MDLLMEVANLKPLQSRPLESSWLPHRDVFRLFSRPAEKWVCISRIQVWVRTARPGIDGPGCERRIESSSEVTILDLLFGPLGTHSFELSTFQIQYSPIFTILHRPFMSLQEWFITSIDGCTRALSTDAF